MKDQGGGTLIWTALVIPVKDEDGPPGLGGIHLGAQG